MCAWQVTVLSLLSPLGVICGTVTFEWKSASVSNNSHIWLIVSNMSHQFLFRSLLGYLVVLRSAVVIPYPLHCRWRFMSFGSLGCPRGSDPIHTELLVSASWFETEIFIGSCKVLLVVQTLFRDLWRPGAVPQNVQFWDERARMSERRFKTWGSLEHSFGLRSIVKLIYPWLSTLTTTQATSSEPRKLKYVELPWIRPLIFVFRSVSGVLQTAEGAKIPSKVQAFIDFWLIIPVGRGRFSRRVKNCTLFFKFSRSAGWQKSFIWTTKLIKAFGYGSFCCWTQGMRYQTTIV